MSKLLIFAYLLIVSVAISAEWKTVSVTAELGEPYLISSCGDAKPPHSYGDNEYPPDYAFPTNDMLYWKKVGSDWVNMTTAEKLAKDGAVKQRALDAAIADASLDALMQTIADAIAGNLKTKEEIKAAFKANVDPKKSGKNPKE